MIQTYDLTEADFRGSQLAEHSTPLMGNNDVLSLTRPDIVEDIHRGFLDAGADIIETNTFGANRISQADYGLQSVVFQMNQAAAHLAVQTAADFSARTPDKPRFVAGAIGPTNNTLSLSPDVNDPSFRPVTFDEMYNAYAEQARGLLDGGVDLLLVETSFDTLVMKAALVAIEDVFEVNGVRLPLMLSTTVADLSGRTLSGQTIEAFWHSVAHAQPLSVGLNCAFGAHQLRPFVVELSRIAATHICCYPNAGLPNEFGHYDQGPDEMASVLKELAIDGCLNIVGGCCGTTPSHIAAIASAVENIPARPIPVITRLSTFCGLEPLEVRPDSNFVMIGERTNVMGSKRFARLIKTGDYEAAVSVARRQVEGGANILDINMDEPLLDSVEAMSTYLRLLATEPEIARIPFMIDSSDFRVIVSGLKQIQGKPLVNSISLKEGEGPFLEQARTVRKFGAAVVVMAFDEEGQAVTTKRRVQILSRAYQLLTEKAGFDPTDIVLDPNVLTVATGIEEHNRYGKSFIQAITELKSKFPSVKISGGISNISFSFRGNNTIREAIHAAFLYHAIAAGLDMGIVNAGQLVIYEDVPSELLEMIEDVLFDRRSDATDRLLEAAQSVRGTKKKKDVRDLAWRQNSLELRLSHALIHGVLDFLESDLDEAIAEYENPLDIVEGPLMAGIRHVGDLFGEGKMFLPQVVKSARVMKKAVAHLQPAMEKRSTNPRNDSLATVLLATVKGDVHDIGKNIVSVILACNGFSIIDLGVMVPTDTIVQTAIDENVDMLGLSGLITPSLEVMTQIAQELERRGSQLPLLIGGATTSKRHTAVRIAPDYSGPTVHVRDASRASQVVRTLINPKSYREFTEENLLQQTKERERYNKQSAKPLLTFEQARANRPKLDWGIPEQPRSSEIQVLSPVPLEDLIPYIDWSPFFTVWEMRGAFPKILEHKKYGKEAAELHAKALEMLEHLAKERRLTAHGVYGFFPASSETEDIILYTDDSRRDELARLCMLRQQRIKAGPEQPNLSLADYVAPVETGLSDHIALFAVTAGTGLQDIVSDYQAQNDDYSAILVKALADRLAEALAEKVHQEIRRDWVYGCDEQLSMEEILREKYRGIRPAPGYPGCPDHTEKRKLFDLLHVEDNIKVALTDTFVMVPGASVCGYCFAHPQSHYFSIKRIGTDQLTSYAKRKGMSLAEAKRWLAPLL